MHPDSVDQHTSRYPETVSRLSDESTNSDFWPHTTTGLELMQDGGGSDCSQAFTPEQICAAQKKDSVLCIVLWYKQWNQFLKEWTKLSLREDGIWCHKTWPTIGHV